jgi:putative phosphoribosyl transferase
MVFENRADAGRRLAAALGRLGGSDVVVLGLPRGGVPVAFEVARTLGAPLDVIVVRKLGVPLQPELAMGAIGEGGVRVLNRSVIGPSAVSEAELASVEERERAELERRARRFRGSRPRTPLEGRTVVVVDDGIATGSTARAACQVARAQGALRVVLAVPVAPVGWEARIDGDADEFICLETPEPFYAIGQFYEDFSQTSDEEVIDCLERASAAATASRDDAPVAREEEVQVMAGPVRLGGHLSVPENASAVVIFAHGSGSSRHSPRNQYVAEVLNGARLATLLFDLLTVEEERDRSNVFDISLLGRRLVDVTRWLGSEAEVAHLPVGYFGASTGAGAALWAASEPGVEVGAVVSRGGRPDLAGTRLAEVSAPTLLIVGGDDEVVLDLNRTAQAQLRCESRLVVIPGATHLFEEPGTLEKASKAARDWFTGHLVAGPRSTWPAGPGPERHSR